MSIQDEDLQNELDAEFRQILFIIKPYINDINDHYRLDRYRVWLEKLSSTSATEKLERNKYLVELANQIHDNVLKPPFTFNPPRGPLPKLRRVEESLIADSNSQDELDLDWPYISPRRKPYVDVGNRRLGLSKEASPQMKKVPKTKMVNRPFQTIGRICDEPTSVRISETSSWYDLSESTTSVTQTDVDEEIKKPSEEKKQSNVKEAERPFSAAGETGEAKILSKERAKQELEALKMRVEDLLEVKNALKDTHVLSEDRKKTIDNLQNKLTQLEKENAELNSLLEAQQKKFTELDKIKTKELNAFKDRVASYRQKEIDQMKQQHLDEIKTLKESHSSQLEIKVQTKVEEVKSEYEQKIKELTESNELALKQKEEEIRWLKDELKNRGDGSLNQQNNERIIALKKCLSKMDKALHKTEKEYVKKIDKLKQELEMKDVSNKMQLEAQRVDLMMQNSVAKQEEIRIALDSLESKYKKMLENVQLYAAKMKKQDEKLIEELRSLLEKQNIAY